MTLKDLTGWAVSAGLASAVLFGYGQHPTVDAIIVTVVWFWFIVAGIVTIALCIVTMAIWRNERRFDEDLGKFYKQISEMSKGFPKNLVGYALIAYWLYALVVQEWTATAVYYVLLVIVTQIYTFATRNLAKEFFLARLKGEGAK